MCIAKTKRSLKNFELSYVHTWERDNNFNKHWSDYTWNCYLDFTLENSFSIISNSQHYQIEINLCMYPTSVFWTLKSLGNTSVKLSWIQPQQSWNKVNFAWTKMQHGFTSSPCKKSKFIEHKQLCRVKSCFQSLDNWT